MDKSTILIFLITFFCLNALLAQKREAFYVELGGAAGIYSFNYDVMFLNQEKGAGLRVGLGVVPYRKRGILIIVPFHVNYILGKGGHHAEIGLGVTSGIDIYSDYDKVQLGFIPSAALMYRYQPLNKRFIFRVGWSPLFILTTDEYHEGAYLSPTFLLWPGASAGFRF